MALHFELVTPARLVRSEDVHMVVVPGAEGEFGVLEGHAPFMSTIRDGAVQVYQTAGSAPESKADSDAAGQSRRDFPTTGAVAQKRCGSLSWLNRKVLRAAASDVSTCGSQPSI